MNSSSSESTFSKQLDAYDIAVLHTLMYFDVFRHPLTIDEIHRNCQWQSCSLTGTAASLENLLQLGIVGKANDFWFLSGSEANINLRLERQERALYFQRKAKKYAKLNINPA